MQNKYQKIDDEFDKRFTLDWTKGFGTTEDIDKLGLSGFKHFLHQSINTVLDEAVEKIRLMKMPKDMRGDMAVGYMTSTADTIQLLNEMKIK